MQKHQEHQQQVANMQVREQQNIYIAVIYEALGALSW